MIHSGKCNGFRWMERGMKMGKEWNGSKDVWGRGANHQRLIY